jgi:hypothetical protein
MIIGLGLAESDFGVKLGSMSVQEPHQGLATAYRKLGKTIQTTGDYHAAQGTAEATTIGDPLQYHSQDSFIVKESPHPPARAIASTAINTKQAERCR